MGGRGGGEGRLLLEPGSPGFESSFVNEQLCDLPKLRFLHLKNGHSDTYSVTSDSLENLPHDARPSKPG